MITQPDDLRIVLDGGPGRTTITLIGELDVATARLLAEQTSPPSMDGGSAEVVVDLADVTFLDAAGLRALLGMRDRLHSFGHEVRFIHASGPVTRLLEIVGVEL